MTLTSTIKMEPTRFMSPGDTLRVTSLADRNSSHDGIVVDVDWPIIRLHTECSFALGTPVTLDSTECMFLGETCSAADKGTGFVVSVLVDQVLALPHLERFKRFNKAMVLDCQRDLERAP